ncbi:MULTISPECIES: hypothetical protein [Wolbachia]|uniref:hypothetical protein n=1 Tax=Wolbachia TaxID=953 RepID=UPI0002FC609C|nr:MULTISPECIES: hypothetical protein [Wolbachia]UYC24172.1 hypothetical protein L3551_02880 [Wolbachia endosymbiont of Aedes aegypti]
MTPLEEALHFAVIRGDIVMGKAVIQYILEHDSCWPIRLDKPSFLNDQEELSNYWDEYKAQVKELHDIVGDRIYLTGDRSTRPIQ